MTKTVSQLNVVGIQILGNSIINDEIIEDSLKANGLDEDDVASYSPVAVKDQNGHLYLIAYTFIRRDGELVWAGSQYALKYVPIDITDKCDKLEFVGNVKSEESEGDDDDDDSEDDDGEVVFSETHVVTYGIDSHGELHVLAHYADTKSGSWGQDGYIAENADDLSEDDLDKSMTLMLVMAAAKDGIDASTDKELTDKIRKVFAK